MPIVFVRLERRNVDPRFTEHTRFVAMPRTEIEHGITTNVQPLRPVLRIRNVKVGVAAAAENRDDIGGPQRAASHPAAAEGPISQHVRVVPLKMEIHAQQVQHCPCKLGLHRGYGDGLYRFPALPRRSLKPPDAVDHLVVPSQHNGQLDAKPRQSPAYVGGLRLKAGHIPAGQLPDAPRGQRQARPKLRPIRIKVGQALGKLMNMGTLKLCPKPHLIGRHGDIVCGPVEKDVQAAPPLLRDVHEHHGNLTRPHGHGHGVALMAGKDFPVRRCDDGKQKTEPGQGKPHQRKAFRIGAAGIVVSGLQAFDRHKLYSAHTPSLRRISAWISAFVKPAVVMRSRSSKRNRSRERGMR